MAGKFFGMKGFIWWLDGQDTWFAETDFMRDGVESFEDDARKVEDYAKDNAPWTDRTGDAREGLTAEVSRDGEAVVLELYHTVEYGLWLEVIQSGEYAIIMPTLEAMAPEVFNDAGTKMLSHRGENPL